MLSHGVFGFNNHYSGLMKDLASKGHIVFAINHADGTCMHTTNSLGIEIPHGHHDLYLKEYRRQQVDQRVDEMLCIVSELTDMEEATHIKVFGTTVPNAKLDMS